MGTLDYLFSFFDRIDHHVEDDDLEETEDPLIGVRDDDDPLTEFPLLPILPLFAFLSFLCFDNSPMISGDFLRACVAAAKASLPP